MDGLIPHLIDLVIELGASEEQMREVQGLLLRTLETHAPRSSRRGEQWLKKQLDALG